MHVLHVLALATSGLVVALLNDSRPAYGPYGLTAGVPSPATGTGDEHASHHFPDTLLDDDRWYKLWCKGNNLVKAMHASDKDAGALFQPPTESAESKWQNSDDLKTWYWHTVTDRDMNKVNFLNDDDDEDFWPGFGLGPVLNDLGLPTHQSDDSERGIRIIYITHIDRYSDEPDQTYQVRGNTYRATGGIYKFGIETRTGAIFGLDRLSPESAAQALNLNIPKEGLPQLQRFSDIAWLYWAQLAPDKHRIQYFFNVAIINTETQMAIRRALKNTNQEFGPWPGAIFDVDSYEGKVLLGSPNGRAYGYFLAQHKAALGGNLYISQIRVFMPESDPAIPYMVLRVEQPESDSDRVAKKREPRERARL